MKYDYQLVISIPTGQTIAACNIVTDSAQWLHKKNIAKSTFVEWSALRGGTVGPQLRYCAENAQAFEKMTDQSRLYIVGHGDLNVTTIAGVSANDLADALVKAGLKRVKRVALAVCLAGNPKSSDPFASLLDGTPLAFASTAKALHKRLGEHKIFTEVAARTEIVAVNGQGKKFTRILSEPPQWVSKKPGTKIVYGWNAEHTEVTRSYPYGEG